MSINENKSVKTYDEGGKGKKQCSSCNKYVGAVTKVCVCGFEFKNQEKSVVAVDVKTYDEGGKGKKQCPQCKKYVGAKTSACACGHDFKEAKATQAVAPSPNPVVVKKEEGQAKPAVNSRMLGCRYSITAPAGACPHKLASTDPEAIDEWADRVRVEFNKESKFLTLSGLIYFVHHFYDMFSPEYQMVRSHLETSLGHERAYGLG
jgi:hypothetical protein